jgi:hypothetical protein
MNVAVFSESPIDEAVLRIFIDGTLGIQTSSAELFKLRARGWPTILKNIGPVLRHLHYRSLAELLVIVADSNNHELHSAAHHPTPHQNCRHCLLESAAAKASQSLQSIQPWHPIKFAIAVPCPSIEAWLLSVDNRECTEAGWSQRRKDGANSVHEIRQLKKQLYGDETPHSFEQSLDIACERAKRLIPHIDAVARAFPNSFGSLIAAIRP